MTARTANAYEVQFNRAVGAVRGASRNAWLAGLGAIARVQSNGPRYIAGLVKDGERFEGRAVKSAEHLVATIKESRSFDAVQKAARPYVTKLQKVYGDTTARVRTQLSKANGHAAGPVRGAAKRTAKRVKRAAKRVRTV